MIVRSILFSLLASYSFSPLSAQCSINPSNVYSFTVGLSDYQIVKENKSWTAANACALASGGHLAIIDSQAEQDTLFNRLNIAGIITNNTTAPDGGGAAYVWLGGNDRAAEGSWLWEDNGPILNQQFWQGARTGSATNGLYNNWGNEPDNFQNQDALGLALSSWPFGSPGQWNDVDENNALYFIIENSNSVGLNQNQLAIEKVQFISNPVLKSFQLKDEGNIRQAAQMQLYNVNGKLVKEFNYRLNGTYNIEEVETGVYLLKVQGIPYHLKLIKN